MQLQELFLFVLLNTPMFVGCRVSKRSISDHSNRLIAHHEMSAAPIVAGRVARAHAQRLSVKDDWPRIEADISEALKYSDDDALYLDKAGIRNSERYNATNERETYERGPFLLEEAHRLDPFNPYFLIHRIALETTALQRATIKKASKTVSDMNLIVLAMDRNNAAVHESVARLKWAEGKFDEALPLIERGNALRPTQGRSRVLEGDIRRALNDGSGAIHAYRRGLALLLDSGDPESIATQHKLILLLSEAGSYQTAADEARRLIARAPARIGVHPARNRLPGNEQPRGSQASFCIRPPTQSRR